MCAGGRCVLNNQKRKSNPRALQQSQETRLTARLHHVGLATIGYQRYQTCASNTSFQLRTREQCCTVSLPAMRHLERRNIQIFCSESSFPCCCGGCCRCCCGGCCRCCFHYRDLVCSLACLTPPQMYGVLYLAAAVLFLQ